MKKFIYILTFLSFQINAFGQQNCEILKDDPQCYKACLTMNQESAHHQGSYASQKNS